MNVFELFAKLGLDTSEYDKGLDGAKSKASKWGSGVATAAQVGVAAVAAVGTAVIGATSAFANQAGKVAEYGDHIDKMSQKMGISAEAYQEWDAIMEHAGANVDSLRPAMKTLSVQAQKGGEAFKKLGISEKEVASLSTEDLFAKVITGLQGMEEGTERTYLASQLLGRGATELGALLNTSAEETEKMRQRVHELGGVMSDEAVKAAARYEDSLQDMQTGLQSLKRNFMSNFLPSFADVIDGLTDIFTGDTKKGLEIISKGIDEMVTKFTDELPKLLEVVGGIIEAILMAIVENLPKIFDAGTELVMNLVDGFIKNLPKIVDAGLKAIIALAEGIAKNIDTIVPAVVEAILKIVETIIKNLPKFLDAVLKIIKGIASGIVKSLPIIIRELPKLINGIVDFIIGAIPQIIDAAIELFLGIVKALPDIVIAIVRALPTLIQGIINGLLSHIGDFVKAGVELLVALISDTPKIILGIVERLPEIVEGIINGFVEAFTNGDFAKAGKALVEGLLKGIFENEDSFISRLMQFFGVPISALKKAYKIQSPSKVMKNFGNMITQGWIDGIEENGDKVVKSMKNINDGVYDALSGDYDMSARMNIASRSNAYGGVQDGYLGGYGDEYEEIIIPKDSSDSGRDLTVILQLDRMELGRAVYQLNKEETQRVGVQLVGVKA